MNKKILAIIPARGGSKSVPRKNLVTAGGRPLIAWTIEASLHSKYVSKTVVTSEDEEILKVSKKFGSDLVVRPKELAKDNTPMVSVILDCLAQLKKRKEKFDILILLQATSPLRNSKDIDNAFKTFFYKKATALISGYEPEKTPYKSFRIAKGGWLRGVVNNKAPFMNRQQLPPTFYPNGAIHIIYIKDFLRVKNFFTTKTVPFQMPIEKSIDIDTLDDVKKIGILLRKNGHNNQ